MGKKCIKFKRLVCLLGMLGLCVSLTLGRAEAAGEIHDALANIMSHYLAGELEEGLTIAEALLSQENLTPQERVAVLSSMSTLTWAQGNRFYEKAKGYLKQIADLGPCLIDLPDRFWVKELRDCWNRELFRRNASLTCFAESTDSDILTVAVMEFDNHSSAQFQEELGSFTKGLAEIFLIGFSQASDIKVVDRNKVNFLLNEYELKERDFAAAVQVGKMLGAKIMVFGSIVQLDKKLGSMVVRAVDVETSEIIATAEMQGTPQAYFKKQGELAKQLAEKLSKRMDEATLKKIDKACTTSAEAASLFAQGLQHMDSFEYGKAHALFKQALEKDESFEEARRLMEIYQPYATMKG